MVSIEGHKAIKRLNSKIDLENRFFLGTEKMDRWLDSGLLKLERTPGAVAVSQVKQSRARAALKKAALVSCRINLSG